jgi:DNA-binding transcriptional MerR regulator
MDVSIPDKYYFRIGEVARILDVETHVIRYWESEFKAVKPVRSKSDQRLYRKKDVVTLQVIKDLLYKDHFTISGAKKQLSKVMGSSVEKERDDFSRDDTPDANDRVKLIQIKKILQEIKEIV